MPPPARPEHGYDGRPRLRAVQEYERLFNEERELPDVRMVPAHSRHAGEESFDFYGPDGSKIGNCAIVRDSPTTAYLADIAVSPGGMGYGRAAYLELLKELVARDIRLVSGTLLSEDSKNVWDWFVEKGIAEKLADGDWRQGYYNGYYEVI